MAILKSGASSDLLTIDPTSNAGRSTLYRPDGSVVLAQPTGAYYLPIPSLPLSTAITAGSCILAMRNGASKIMRIKRIVLNVGFSGTVAATTSGFQLCRFATAAPTGGTTLSAIKKRTTYGPSTIADARYNFAAALGVTGVAFETQFAEIGCQRQLAARGVLYLIADLVTNEIVFEIQPSEGLAVKLGVVAVIGDTLGGCIEWEEV